MKKFKAILVLVVLGIVFSIGVMAQGPPNPPSDPTAGGNQPPTGPLAAPIEPGTGILLILAAAYGLKKVQSLRVKEGKRVRG
jgi:hypothetical protein